MEPAVHLIDLSHRLTHERLNRTCLPHENEQYLRQLLLHNSLQAPVFFFRLSVLKRWTFVFQSYLTLENVLSKTSLISSVHVDNRWTIRFQTKMDIACAQALFGGGGPRADMGTLLIFHFKVLIFPHRWVFISSKQDLKTHFILVLWTVSQSSRHQTFWSWKYTVTQRLLILLSRIVHKFI